MIGVEIVTDKKARTPGGAERDRIVELAFERGVLLLGCGPNTIRIAPPLIVSKEQADIALDVLEECIKLVAEGASQQKGDARAEPSALSIRRA